MIHIGHLIEQELHRQEHTVTWLAEKLCCDRTNVYKIFKKQSIDTGQLARLCRILNHNFFEDYAYDFHSSSPPCLDGEDGACGQ